ncbi:hypothetical protein SAMN02745166_03601 [Prosthecobacter debontii]|uniref:Uncharacterized protein n=1 Tax=Prosthecobacter debontii TaxID=48467 RepID=A0A1T4YKN5_9BACT|nr:hypothetical protein SAMN02745166_03601 [Prosthecobacter debontii]
MSKFMCSCGEIIYDQSDRLPYKGYFFADTQYFDIIDKITEEITDFIEARVAGREREWIGQSFLKGYPCNKDSDVVHDIITRHLSQGNRDVYQCSNCGRIHVECRGDSSRLDSFSPDETLHKDVFSR